jgi:dTDP-4-dehydrorhamnose 3,5-epimerase
VQVTWLDLAGLALVRRDVRRDDRGFFVECYRAEHFRAHDIPARFVQLNHSRSRAGVLRGLHYQARPAQGKLVGVTRGRIWDVAVDLRPDSATFGKSFAAVLDDEAGLLLWIPPGFAHGFCVLGDEPADVLYQVDAPYEPSGEGGIRWDDPELAIAWPLGAPLVSSRDRQLPSFAEYRARPAPWPVSHPVPAEHGLDASPVAVAR